MSATANKMPRLSRGVSLAVIAAVGLGLAGCATEATPGSAEVVTITYTDNSPEQSTEARAIIAFQEAVTERTEGRIQFRNFWSSAYLSGNEALGGTRDGLADMSLLLTSYFPEELPLSQVLLNHANSFIADYPQGFVQSMASTYEMFGSDILRAEYEAHNLVPLGGFSIADEYGLNCTSPIDSVADANGKISRTGGRTFAREVSSIGIEPVTIPSTEQYEALQRGVIDCVVVAPQHLLSLKTWEVAKHYSFACLSGYPGYAFVINKDTWERISEADQQILRDELPTVLAGLIENTMADFAEVAAGAAEQGLTFSYSPEIRALVKAAVQDEDDPELASVVEKWREIMLRWEALIDETLPSTWSAEDSGDAGAEYLQKFLDGPSLDLTELYAMLDSEL